MAGYTPSRGRFVNRPITGDQQIITGSALLVLRTMLDRQVQCCVTSPPYWSLRDYGVEGQLGLEKTPEEYVSKLVEILREVRRVLRDDGTLWLNIGDCYASDDKWGGSTGGKHANGLHGDPIGRSKRNTGLKSKDLVGIPWMTAFALRADGWYLRSDIIWAKPNPMPESVTDRPTRSHEYIFLLTKSQKYYYDFESIKEPAVSTHPSGNGYKRDSRLTYLDDSGARGSDEQWQPKGRGGVTAFRGQGHFRTSDTGPANREGREMLDIGTGDTRNKRDVWTVNVRSYRDAHFATFPPKLIEPCILAGCPKDGLVLDPFSGAGTTALVCRELSRRFIGIELKEEYVDMANRRLA